MSNSVRCAQDGSSRMDTIGQLLSASLLSDLGDDPDRVERVRAASKALADRLVDELRAGVPAAVLSALDSTSTEDHDVLDAAGEALQQQWETFRNAFASTPCELLRAVALAAVVEVAERDEDLRAACWYAIRTVLDRIDVGPWRDHAAQLEESLSEALAGLLNALWTPEAASSSLRMPAVDESPAKLTFASQKMTEIAANVVASGNHNTFSQQLMAEFDAYTKEVASLANAAGSAAQERSASQLKQFVTELGAKLRQTLVAQEAAGRAAMLRSDLLWWRQAAWSSVADAAYVSLKLPADVAVTAAIDVHRLVPKIAPRSVEHLLADLVATVTSGADVTVGDLQKSGFAAQLATDETDELGPFTLAEAISSRGSTQIVGEREPISAASAAVIVFRDLQAARLAAPSP